MVCQNCREQPRESTARHKYCINKWRQDPKDDAVIIPRDMPIKTCVCQHKKSWNYVESVTQETKDTNGDRKES